MKKSMETLLIPRANYVLARRVLLMLVLLLGGANLVWGDFTPYNGGDYSAVSTDTKTTPLSVVDNKITFSNIDMSSYLADGDEMYFRFAIVDKNDNRVSIPNVAFNASASGLIDYVQLDGNFGWGWADWQSKSTITGRNTIITVPSVVSGNNFKLYCYISNTVADGTKWTDGSNKTEPTVTQILIYPISAPALTEATLTATITRENYSITPQALDLSSDADVAAVYDAADVTKGGGNFYVRWYLLDASDNVVDPSTEGVTMTPESSVTFKNMTGSNAGLIWTYTDGTSYSDNLLKMTVTPNSSSVNLNKYKVRCVLTTAAGAGQYVSSSDDFSATPTLNIIYTYSFSSSFAGYATGENTHAKEVLIPTGQTTVSIPLADSFDKILNEYGKTVSNVLDDLHMRWYVTYDGEMVANSETMLAASDYDTSNQSSHGNSQKTSHQKKTDYGLYWNSKTNLKADGTNFYDVIHSWHENWDLATIFNINFTPDLSGKDWRKYKVYVVMSDDTSASSGEVVSGSPGAYVLDHEPNKLNMQYIFSFFPEGDFQFVHYNGAANPERNFIKKTSSTTQYYWNNSNSSVVKNTTGDIRQGVHTVIYDLYMNSTTELELPFKDYDGSGDVLEPAAYIRWYDWDTDLGSSKLTNVGSALADLQEYIDPDDTSLGQRSRGYFMLNRDTPGIKPIHSLVGVTYNPSSLGANDVDTIACDVSKYYDGIYGGSTGEYMIHEPTISTRYLFAIHKASAIASKIATGETKFNTKGSDMFELCEDNGRVCVSVNDESSEFVVRANLSTIGNYFINSGSTQCTEIKWYAFYEDETGLYKNETALAQSNSDHTARISPFKLSSLNGNYAKVKGDGPDTKTGLVAAAGMRFHLVGYVGSGSLSAPAVHYELNFLKAPAVEVDNLSSYKERTIEYMTEHLDWQATVDFDDKIADSDGNPIMTLASQADNMTENPLNWSEAQYGFCYPQIDKFRIQTGTNDPNGMTPIHGDYMLLKSMNDADFSLNGKSAKMTYKYNWYTSSPTLYDYTHKYLTTNTSEFGTYLYVDASDESRTIATLDFNANLCKGSEIYFTAAIADMTESGKTSPQVMATVYGVKSDNTLVPVVSFLSCELKTVSATSYAIGKWYQIYGHATIPSNIETSTFKNYKVNIDNYSRNTSGADYCVDQIMFYTSTGKMKVEQAGGGCDGESLRLTNYIAVEQLENKGLTLTDTGTNIYYRVFKKTGEATVSGKTKVLYEPYGDTSIYNNSGNDYGQVNIKKYKLDSDGTLTSDAVNENYMFKDGILYFNIVKAMEIDLEQGNEYFFVLTKSLSAPDTDTDISKIETCWASPNEACDVFSNFFVPLMSYVSFTDTSGDDASTTIGGSCMGGASSDVDYTVKVNVPDNNEASGFKKLEGVKFDFFTGTATEYKAISNLALALADFRKWDKATNGDYKDYSSSGLDAAISSYASASGYPNAATYAPILTTNKSKITFSASTKFKKTITETQTYLAIPVTTEWSGVEVCSYIPFTFTVTGGGGKPVLQLGFADVTYPGSYKKRVVRIGLEQLTNLKDDYLLHVPVSAFKDKNAATANSLVFYGADLKLTASSDPTAAADVTAQTTVATLQNIGTDSRPMVNTDRMYLSLKFPATGGIAFHEGYEYEVSTVFYDLTDDSGGIPSTSACRDDLYLILKVVPKYVTWNDAASVTPNANSSDNWSGDDNWSRSSKTEIYSPAYEDNTTIDASLTSTPATYVPMKFSYVTMTKSSRAPRLISPVLGTTATGSAMDNGIITNIGGGATANIEYDMMARYSEKTCQGGYSGHTAVAGNIYDCEKFYTNICKEIYFKPEAELLNQQYLTYDTARVEKELVAGQWYLMSAPLKETYAGDMYVPSDNGRQETEAFTPITFTGSGYSRTALPFYQRSWDRNDSKVYTASDSYTADLGYTTWSGAVGTTLAQWSHTYNDVDVNYSALQGFSIRAEREASTGDPVLLRLPKGDAGYPYVDYQDNPSSGTNQSTFSRATTGGAGKLQTDGTTDGAVAGAVATLQADGNTYYLIGNPYMASIDMAQFLATNSGCGSKYWRYEDGAPTAETGLTGGIIRPMEAFFVKAGSKPTVSFTKDMMTDGNYTKSDDGNGNETGGSDGSGGNPTTGPNGVRPMLTLSATDGRVRSKARLIIDADAQEGFADDEDAETLFDSQLSDVPVVYTVAGSQAVSVDVRPSATLVPFGVVCADSDTPVELTVSGLQSMVYGSRGDADGARLFVLDAQTGETLEVNDGLTLTVQPNDYGRYFLASRVTTGIASAQTIGGIIVSVRGRQLTVTSADGPLTGLRILTTAGATLRQERPASSEATLQLSQPGVYIVEASTTDRQKTMKVVVK